MAHREQLIHWAMAFNEEALRDQPTERDRIAELVDARLDAGNAAGLLVWEVAGGPVAMTGHSGPTGTGIRVNMVYTPPQHRGLGYATALVAYQSQWLRDEGYESVCLYTDLANPTSNAIYERIGYKRVGEAARYGLGAG